MGKWLEAPISKNSDQMLSFPSMLCLTALDMATSRWRSAKQAILSVSNTEWALAPYHLQVEGQDPYNGGWQRRWRSVHLRATRPHEDRFLTCHHNCMWPPWGGGARLVWLCMGLPHATEAAVCSMNKLLNWQDVLILQILIIQSDKWH